MTRQGMVMKKYTADTYNEAYIKARAELGPDAMIITSQRVMTSDWGGLYSREVIELTAVAPHAVDDHDAATHVARPPMHGPTGGTGGRSTPTAAARPGPSSAPAGYGPNARPMAPMTSDAGARMPASPIGPINPVTIKGGPAARIEGGLRDIQSGDDDPETAARDKVLQQLLQQHIERKRQPTGPGTQPVLAGLQPTPAQPPVDEMQRMREELERIRGMLQNLQAHATEVNQRPTAANLPAGLASLRSALASIETPDNVLENILEDLEGRAPARALSSVEAIRKAFVMRLQERLTFAPPIPPRTDKGPTIAAIIGPTGVGKTTTLAKLAAFFALNTGGDRRKVALFTFDTYRIGACQQLAQYAAIIEVPLEIIPATSDLDKALLDHADKDLILVDTAGQSQKNRVNLEELRDLLGHIPTAIRFLALAATTKYSDMVERERAFGEVGYDHLIFTKVDETCGTGPLLALLLETGRRLAYITNGQTVPDDIQVANPGFFINAVCRD